MHPCAECRLYILQLWVLFRLRGRRWWIPFLVAAVTAIPLGIALLARSVGPEGMVALRQAQHFPSLYLNNATVEPMFRRLAYAPSNAYTDFVMQKVNATFRGLKLERFNTTEELEKRLMASDKALGVDMAAILFSPPMEAVHLEYTFRLAPFPHDATSRTDKIRSSWKKPGPRRMYLREKEELPLLVTSIFLGHLEHWQYSMPPIFLQQFPFPAYAPDVSFLGIVHWIPTLVVMCPVIFVLYFVYITAEEHELHLHLRMMNFGVQNAITSFLRAFLPAFMWACLTTLLLHVKVAGRRVALLGATSWEVSMVLLLVYTFQLTLVGLCLALLFRKRLWCITTVMFIWFGTCVLPALLLKRHASVHYRDKLLSSILLPNFGVFWAFRDVSASEATGMGITMTSSMDITLLGYVGLLAASSALFICYLCIIAWVYSQQHSFISCWQRMSCQSAQGETADGEDSVDQSPNNLELANRSLAADQTAETHIPRELLVLEDIRASTRQGVILHDVNLHVPAGKIMVVLDQHACGITELFKIVVGHKKPNKGKVERKYNSLGVQPSDSNYLLSTPIREMLVLLARLQGCPEEEAEENIKSALERLKLDELDTKKDEKDLLQCVRSRLRVAVACVGSPELIVLKDPTALMTPIGREATWDYLRHLRDPKRSILLMTSSSNETESLADTLAILDAGRIQRCGSLRFIRKTLETGYEIRMCKGPNWDASKMNCLKQAPDRETSSNISYCINEKEPQELAELLHTLEALERNGHISGIELRVRTLHDQISRLNSPDETDSCSLTPVKSIQSDNVVCTQLIGILEKKYSITRRAWKFPVIVFIIAFLVAYLVPEIIARLLGYTSRIGSQDILMPLRTYTAPYHSTILSAPPEEPFVRHFFNNSVKVQSIPKEVLRGGLQGYADRFQIGIEVLRSGIITWFNGALLHTSLVSLVSVQDAVLKNLTQNESAAVIASNHPLLDSLLYARTLSAAGYRFGSGTFICIALSLLAAIPAAQVAQERASNFYRLQMSTGLRPVVYWMGNFLWDASQGLIYAALMASLEAAVDRTGDIRRDSAAALFVLLLMHSLSVLPLVYLLAMAFSPLWAFLATFFGGSIIGCCGIWFTTVQQTSALEDGTSRDGAAMWAMRILTPFFAAPWGATNLRLAGSLRKMCSIHQTLEESRSAVDMRCFEWTCYNGTCPSMGPWSLTEGGVGDEILALVIGAVLLWLLLIDTWFWKAVSRIEDCYVVVNAATLCKKWKSGFELRNISLSVKSGEHLGIIGLARSGKSSVLQMIAGDVAPSSGEVTVTRSVGFCPQETWIPKDITAQEVLRLFARIRGVKNVNECCEEWLKIIGVQGESICGHLGPGEQRLVSVCCAFVGHPKLVLLDEPCAHMETSQVQRFRHILVSNKEDVATVVTSRRIDDCLDVCSSVMHMENGILKQWHTSRDEDGRQMLLVHFGGPRFETKEHDYSGASRSAAIKEIIETYMTHNFLVEDATRESRYRADQRAFPAHRI